LLSPKLSELAAQLLQYGFTFGVTLSGVTKNFGDDRIVGRSKARHFDFSMEIYDSDGNCETMVEITAPLPCDAEAEFRHTVDKLEDRTLSIP
jgi:hypothetical protein